MVVFDKKLDLEQWRGVRKMSKKELADKSGVSDNTISTFEKYPEKMKDAKYPTLSKLAKALDIEVSDFKNF